MTAETGSLEGALRAAARDAGFVRVGIAAAEPEREAREIALRRVAEGSFAGLAWFHAERVVRATDPERVLPGARSLVLLAASYRHEAPAPPDGRLRGRVARYAWGRDYHRVLERRARPLVDLLAARAPGSTSRVLVDHGPLLERAYARRGGVGWQGKNTMLLSRGAGSWTFLAAILTTAELEPDAPATQSCGSCTRCLPSCPTGALRSEYELVNDLCIAYQTIENRGPIPRALRPLVGDWVFGCDLCQESCPVNERDVAPGLDEFRPADPADAFPDLVELLDIDADGFRARFAGRAVARAKWAGLLRNACVVLGNLGDRRAVAPLERALDHAEALVRGHAAWALGRFGERAALERRLGTESDAWVREEIREALADAR